MVLVDVARAGLTGVVAEKALESCGIVVNKNVVPGDRHGPRVTSGIRFGTNTLALRGMGATAIRESTAVVDRVWRAVEPLTPDTFRLPEPVRADAARSVATLCTTYPLYRRRTGPSRWS
jgi:glycine hydroxymethyltransferase